jgi:hypothetical protein
VDEVAIERAARRLAQADEERPEPAAVDAALERARAQLEALAETAARLEATIGDGVRESVRAGLGAETVSVARQLAETRGLTAQAIRRLERMEGDLLAERYARVDDLAVLVDLVTSGWRSIEGRLGRIEATLASRRAA